VSETLPPKWVSKAQARYMHEITIARHGGSAGLRDEGLLESALGRAENFYAYGERNIFRLAAAYAEGIARNHAFVDGNKRTGYMVAGLFLLFNGYNLQIRSVSEQITLFENLAQGRINLDNLAQFYREQSSLIEK